MNDLRPKDRIIVALDVDTSEEALNLIHELGDSVGVYKVGLQLLTNEGPAVFARMVAKYTNARFFYDAKFHDIAHTVAAAVRNAAQLPGIEFVSVHAANSRNTLRAARAAAGDCKLLAITALTDLDDEECADVFRARAGDAGVEPRRATVARLAQSAEECGVGGVVCGADELNACGPDALRVVPGIRPEWAASRGDQKSVSTPRQAILDGADYLIVGRPIREPPSAIGSPLAAANSIAREIGHALIDWEHGVRR